MCLLIQHTTHHTDQSQHPTVLHIHLPDQCTAAYPSVVTRITTPPQCAWTLPDSSRDAAPGPSDDEESSNEDEDFQTVPMDNEHWTTEMIPERTFCIHENGLPNNVCSYPCPYGTDNTTSYIDSLDLSNISDIKDHFLTTSDEEELPGLEEVPYWTVVCLNTYLTFSSQYIALNFVHTHLNIN